MKDSALSIKWLGLVEYKVTVQDVLNICGESVEPSGRAVEVDVSRGRSMPYARLGWAYTRCEASEYG